MSTAALLITLGVYSASVQSFPLGLFKNRREMPMGGVTLRKPPCGPEPDPDISCEVTTCALVAGIDDNGEWKSDEWFETTCGVAPIDRPDVVDYYNFDNDYDNYFRQAKTTSTEMPIFRSWYTNREKRLGENCVHLANCMTWMPKKK